MSPSWRDGSGLVRVEHRLAARFLRPYHYDLFPLNPWTGNRYFYTVSHSHAYAVVWMDVQTPQAERIGAQPVYLLASHLPLRTGMVSLHSGCSRYEGNALAVQACLNSDSRAASGEENVYKTLSP